MMPAMPATWRAAALAWRDTRRAFVAMPALAGIALAIATALQLVETLAEPTAPGSLGLGLLVSLAQAFVLTPYLIAVHRFIILGEVTRRYALEPSEWRFQRFFGWSVVLRLMSSVPILSMQLLPLSLGVQVALILIVTVVILVLSLRITILFPAVAVDAPGATWSNAIADTRGYALRIFIVGLMTVFPLLVVSTLLLYAAGLRRPAGIAGKLVAIISGGALSTLSLTLLVVIASRFYEWLGDRVTRPDGAAGHQ
jgi:hypothetical protein